MLKLRKLDNCCIYCGKFVHVYELCCNEVHNQLLYEDIDGNQYFLDELLDIPYEIVDIKEMVDLVINQHYDLLKRLKD